MSLDFSDLPDMTVEYIDLSVLHTSCLSMPLLYLTLYKIIMDYYG